MSKIASGAYLNSLSQGMVPSNTKCYTYEYMSTLPVTISGSYGSTQLVKESDIYYAAPIDLYFYNLTSDSYHVALINDQGVVQSNYATNVPAMARVPVSFTVPRNIMNATTPWYYVTFKCTSSFYLDVCEMDCVDSNNLEVYERRVAVLGSDYMDTVRSAGITHYLMQYVINNALYFNIKSSSLGGGSDFPGLGGGTR